MHPGYFSITALLAWTGLVHATPLLNQRQYTPPSDRWYVQTRVVGTNQDTGSNKNGLWVYSYHTGAGLGDAALSTNRSSAMEAYLNGTQLSFTYPGSPGPWPFAVSYGPYQSFLATTISIAGSPSPDAPGFFLNTTGLQYDYPNRGWLACDWWHGQPQLFSLSASSYGPLPTSCSQVELHPAAI